MGSLGRGKWDLSRAKAMASMPIPGRQRNCSIDRPNAKAQRRQKGGSLFDARWSAWLGTILIRSSSDLGTETFRGGQLAAVSNRTLEATLPVQKVVALTMRLCI